MEKTLHFGGRDVKFRATMRTLLLYKQQTGREYMADVQKLSGLVKLGADKKPILGEDGKPIIDLAYLDTEALCAVAWAMAKTADANTAPLMDWLDEFDEFPLLSILADLIPMLNDFMKPDAKNA